MQNLVFVSEMDTDDIMDDLEETKEKSRSFELLVSCQRLIFSKLLSLQFTSQTGKKFTRLHHL